MSIIKPQTVNYLEFDGINDFVDINNPIRKTVDTWTVSTRVLYRDTSSGGVIFSGNDGVNDLGFQVGLIQNGELRFVFGEGGSSWTTTSFTGFSPNLNQVYDITITGSFSDNLQLYVDGNLVFTDAIATDLDFMDTGIRIGMNNNGNVPLDGNIYNIQIWDKILTSSEINNYISNFPNGTENNLIHYWNFQEGSGSTLNDLVGNLDGTIVGATWDSEQVLPEIQNIYKGSTEISKVFKGNTLVFQSVSYIDATGGTITTYEDNGTFYKSHTFTSSGNFVVNSLGDNNDLDYLIIAGGGSGSSSGVGGGGGGAGGYRTTLGTSGGNSSAESKITANAQSYTITVGAGGPSKGSSSSSAIYTSAGNNGSNTSALGITSIGGGGGGSGYDEGPATNGGSGGGAGGRLKSTQGASGTANQGTNGGNTGTGSGSNQEYLGAGGGGAGQSGQNGTSSIGGLGGNGLANTLRDKTSETRAGGGGGADGDGPAISGGTGGGGNGGTKIDNAQNAQVNTGSGGGGGSWPQPNAGGSGGSGIVIIRYEVGGL